MKEEAKLITMEKASLMGYKGKFRAGAHQIAVEVITVLTKRMATDIAAPWLFDAESFPRRFGKIDLDNEFRSVKVRFSIKGLEQYDFCFEPDTLTKFVCMRKGDGKKKAKILALKFQAQYRGNMHDLIDTFERLGSGEGTLTVEQLQTTLNFEPDKKAKTTPTQPARKKHAVQ